MKFLTLEPTYRRWLNSKNALAFDSDLNEKLIGLTHSESIFFVQMVNTYDPGRLQTIDELERFMDLHDRHEFALLNRRS
jgi:hypothetical protein